MTELELALAALGQWEARVAHGLGEVGISGQQKGLRLSKEEPDLPISLFQGHRERHRAALLWNTPNTQPICQGGIPWTHQNVPAAKGSGGREELGRAESAWEVKCIPARSKSSLKTYSQDEGRKPWAGWRPGHGQHCTSCVPPNFLCVCSHRKSFGFRR